jgi:hypothetical protein
LDFEREVVFFFGHDGDSRVRCAISREALDDDFRGEDRDKVEVFRENRAAIEQGVRQKYAAGDTEPDGSVLIHSGELKPRVARKLGDMDWFSALASCVCSQLVKGQFASGFLTT